MSDPWGGEENRTKADGLATIINKVLQNLVVESAKSEGVRDYFHVAVIGYGSQVGPAFSGPLAGRDLVPISDVAENPARLEERTQKVDDGVGGVIEQKVKLPIWFDAVAQNGTPMCEALRQAESLVERWTNDHPDSFPPVIINISDGESTDGDPIDAAESLRSRSTSDGKVLLLNVHLSSHKGQSAIYFPDNESGLPDQHARKLFNMSNVLPGQMQDRAKRSGYQVSEASRGFIYQADPVAVIEFLEIGTRPSNLR